MILLNKKVIFFLGLFILGILFLPNIIMYLFYFLLYELTNPITITYTLEFSRVPFIVALFCFIPYMLLLKFGKFTDFGKKFLFYGSLIGFLVGVLNLSIYTTATENSITKHYYFMSKEYKWENVNHVYTYVNKETKYGPKGSQSTVTTKKYELNLNDGSKINVWDNNIDHLYNLHQLVKQKNITTKHSTPYFLGDEIYLIVHGNNQKIKEILGMDEIIRQSAK